MISYNLFMSVEKELAYRYDLLITPTWRDRFDSLVNENLALPEKGRVLDVNCGTGAHAIELAEQMRGLGDVFGVDPDGERIDIARIKAQAKKLGEATFQTADARRLPFADNDFIIVIGDASMAATRDLEPMLDEMVRVAEPEATVILKLATHGSFDEFFSILWEALFNAGISEAVWGKLETLINERITITAAKEMAARAGLRRIVSIVSKEEFEFESAVEFLESPMIKDVFLDSWLAFIPDAKRPQVVDEIDSIIEDARHGNTFDLSIKATLIKGVK
jgi:ubiquinone/menaquinone biosynthesis C-methylase UbiE